MVKNQAKNQYLGITAPLSTAEPTEKDLALTQDLVRTLHEHDVFEPYTRTVARNELISLLQTITREVVAQLIFKATGRNTDGGGRVVTYGSFHLGVHSKESDIDTLCVIPKTVTREQFFDAMVKQLKSIPEVTKLIAVKDSYVPVIKFKYQDISIDLVCARVNVARVSTDLDLNDTQLLIGIDASSIRSLNGHRVSNDILKLVPNVETYRKSLRCIKLWASQRSLSSNVLGFFGGIAWALSVARVCQLYPSACPSVVISKFFYILYNWSWPTPIQLREILDGPALPPPMRPWNAKVNLHDRTHRMPVITPSYPSMCATYNVTDSTFIIIKGELKLAMTKVEDIYNRGLSWNTLFEPDTFFQNYYHYLQVVVSSDSEDKLTTWAGLVEAKLRVLVMSLELQPDVKVAHPYAKGFYHKHLCENQESICLVTRGQLPQGTSTSDEEGFVNVSTHYTKVFYIGLYISPVDGLPGKVNVQNSVYKFISVSKASKLFEQHSMGLTVELLHRTQLPQELLIQQ